jgi:hypothetical protein
MRSFVITIDPAGLGWLDIEIAVAHMMDELREKNPRVSAELVSREEECINEYVPR